MGHVKHLIEAYLDNELTAGRRRQVETHLAECTSCRSELTHLKALSQLLAEYRMPEPIVSAEKFRSQVVLRLPRRSQRRPEYAHWGWHLVPLTLLCLMSFILALLALTNVTPALLTLLGWGGTDWTLLFEISSTAGMSPSLYRALVDLVMRFSSLVWQLTIHITLLFVFLFYAGWVGVLWRTTTQPSVRKER